MKVCVVQPLYSMDFSKTQEFFEWEMRKFDECDESLDLIVFPESCDVPCLAPTNELSKQTSDKYRDLLLEKAAQTAKRCHAIVVVNVHAEEKNGLRNTTLVYDRNGNEVFAYYKQHLTPGETEWLDSDYTWDYEEPYVFELEGFRFAFLTCYDFYFYEAYAAIARKNIDIVIGCSHQRSDTFSALETINKFCAYHLNAYLVRSSVSMGDIPLGGCSCVIAPNGEVLVDMKGAVGTACVEIDPSKKYYKPAGFNNPPSAHYQYIETGRRPWKYRPGGSAICRYDDVMAYPRTCAHRGFSTVAPENTMPAFGAAVALGAEEIEFDLWATKDGVLVSCHDDTLERVSNGTGKIEDYTYEELLQFDFGVKHGERFKGLKIATFEEILKKFACHTIMNIHVKIWDAASDLMIEKIVGLIRKYDCEKWVYFMSSNDEALRLVHEFAPDLKRCVGWDGDQDKMSIVRRAIALKADKIQLFRPYFDESTVKAAHENGIICNVFWADEPEMARKYLDMGIDTILTNDYHTISQIVEEYKKK